MKKMIHIGLIFLLFVSCNNRRTSIDKNTIQELSEGDFKSPSQYGYLLLFVHSIDSVGYTNINILHHIYVRKYSADYNNFNSFLSDALNQEILFPDEVLRNSNVKLFSINGFIKREYNQHGISNFFNLYCIKKKNEFIIKKQYQNSNMLYTILFYFFINNYRISSDDYIGQFSVSK
jgi:hypothetical protein